MSNSLIVSLALSPEVVGLSFFFYCSEKLLQVARKVSVKLKYKGVFPTAVLKGYGGIFIPHRDASLSVIHLVHL